MSTVRKALAVLLCALAPTQLRAEESYSNIAVVLHPMRGASTQISDESGSLRISDDGGIIVRILGCERKLEPFPDRNPFAPDFPSRAWLQDRKMSFIAGPDQTRRPIQRGLIEFGKRVSLKSSGLIDDLPCEARPGTAIVYALSAARADNEDVLVVDLRSYRRSGSDDAELSLQVTAIFARDRLTPAQKERAARWLEELGLEAAKSWVRK